MKSIVKFSAAALAFASTPAFAQDAAPMMGGFYVGALAGIDSVRVSDGTDSASKTGAVFGVTAGYDLDMGNAVVGLEGEFADSSTKDSATDILVTGDSAKLSAGRDLYVGARLGFNAGSRTLVYVKAGYTNARAKLTYDDGTGPLSGHDDLDGWRAGAGVEFAVAPHIAIRGEYRYSDYGDYHFAGVNTGLSVQRHQGVVAVIGKF